MQYQPAPYLQSFVWCRSDPEGHQGGSASDSQQWVLPTALFDLLNGGTYTPEEYQAGWMAARAYDTEAEALADLEQAKHQQ
jgi:hypothetical protein